MYISDCILALLSFRSKTRPMQKVSSSYRTRSVTRRGWTAAEAELVKAHQTAYAMDQDRAPYAYLEEDTEPWSVIPPLLTEKEDGPFAFAPDAPAEFLLCHSLLDRVNQPEFKEPTAFAPLTIVGLGEEPLLSDLPPLPAAAAAAFGGAVDAPSPACCWPASDACCDDRWAAFSEIVAILSARTY